MNATVKTILVATAGGILTFGAIEVAKLVKTAQGLTVNPGKIKLGVPTTRIDALDHSKKQTVIPIQVTALLTNTTGGTLSFNHPTATVFYKNTQVAISDASTREHTLGAFVKDYPLTLYFDIDIAKLGDSLKNFYGFFLQPFSQNQPAKQPILFSH